MSSRGLRIAIDGPSGSGKSTLARRLAVRLGLSYVDTGAMYRAVAWKARRMDARAPDELRALLDDTTLEVRADPGEFAVLVDGADVTRELRSPEIGEWASHVAMNGEVRDWLVRRQRDLAREGVVMEGRDIGTVVLPEADHKFFITADEPVRMRRRAAQLSPERRGDARRDVSERDRRDRNRAASPLRPSADAVVVDTTDQEVGESLETLLEEIDEPGG